MTVEIFYFTKQTNGGCVITSGGHLISLFTKSFPFYLPKPKLITLTTNTNPNPSTDSKHNANPNPSPITLPLNLTS